MIRKLIAIDLQPMERRARELGFDYFPLKEIRETYVAQGVDVLDMLVTLPIYQPEDDSDEAAGLQRKRFESKRFALQKNGARVIECPTKRSCCTASGIKHSDDQRLMLETFFLAIKIRPDYVVLFAADGDYAPLVEMLRREGIRTEVVASASMLANDLACHSVRVVDFDEVLSRFEPSYLIGH